MMVQTVVYTIAYLMLGLVSGIAIHRLDEPVDGVGGRRAPYGQADTDSAQSR
jgi:hypothetical protein